MPAGKPFPAGEVIDNTGNGQSTLIGDSQPLGDDCSDRDQVQFSAANQQRRRPAERQRHHVGLLRGRLQPTATKPDGTAVCGAVHNIGAALGGTGKTGALPFGTKPDYIPHHEPFQYYPSTANPHHLRPGSVDMIGSVLTRPTTNTTCRISGPRPTPATCPRSVS